MKYEIRLFIKDIKEFKKDITQKEFLGMLLVALTSWVIIIYISYLVWLLMLIAIYVFVYAYLEYHSQCT